ncbi:MAG: SRPBCC family protein [Povalibacter sp.]
MRNLTESSQYRYRRGARKPPASRGGRSYVGVTLALTGVAVLGAIGVQALNRNSQSGRRSGIARSASPRSPEVERSLTVEKSPEELYPLWSDPQNFQRIIGHFAKVEMIDERRARWTAPGPLGQWIMRLVENRPNEFMRWEPEDSSAPLQESTVRFIPARGKPGTVVQMHMLLNPPHGVIGQAAARFMHNAIPGEIASKTLHYFKSLALTGEIPTTDRQPAARRDPR